MVCHIVLDGCSCGGVMLLGGTSQGFPSQGYKELPVFPHWHWGKECQDPPDPGSRVFPISAVSPVVTLSV